MKCLTYLGREGSSPNHVQASAGGNTILRWDGKIWAGISAGGTASNEPAGVMMMLSATEGYYTSCNGFGVWNGRAWKFHRSFDFCDVTSGFGMRDSKGKLALYTAGAQNFSNGIRVWAFNGLNFGSKCQTVLSDPSNGKYICGGILAGHGAYGYATGIWASASNDIYVSGRLGYPTSTGRVYRFDGARWENITAPLSAVAGGTLPVATTVFGTAADDVWIPLADGRLLRYTSGE